MSKMAAVAKRYLAALLGLLLSTAFPGMAVGEIITREWRGVIMNNSLTPGPRPFEIPFDFSVGQVVTGSYTIDLLDPGYEFATDVYYYADQPVNLLTLEIDGFSLLDGPPAPATFVDISNEPTFLGPGYENIRIQKDVNEKSAIEGSVVTAAIVFASIGADYLSDTSLPRDIFLSDWDRAQFSARVSPGGPQILNFYGDITYVETSPVPLPGALGLLAGAIAALGILAQRRKIAPA